MAILSLLIALMSHALLPTSAWVNDTPPRIGDVAPEIKLDKLLQAPKGTVANWKSLRGKVVVLEFWATWCGPCIPAMDHLSELAEKFKGKSLQIIAITDEEEARVLRHLARKPARMWIGLDTDRSMFDAYQPRTIPHTVVVNQARRIAAVTHPENVTAEVIEKLLEGKPIDLPLKESGYISESAFEQREQELDAKTLFKAVIRPSESPSGWMKAYGPDSEFEGRRLTADGVWPLALLARAYNAPVNYFVDEAGLPQLGYFVDVIVPRGKEQLLDSTFRQLLLTGLNVSVRRETREMEVVVLRRIEDVPTPLRVSEAKESAYSMRGPKMNAVKQPIKVLVEYVGNFSREPVIDETGLEGEYDFTMDWIMGDKASFDEALAKLGLKRVKEKHPFQVLVIERTSAP